MDKIRFEPSGNQVEITDGDTILTAADRAGVLIIAPCGGKGVCRKCTVTIDGQKVLACLHQPKSDSVVSVSHFHPAGDGSERKALDYIHKVLLDEGQKSNRLLAIDLGTTGISVAWMDPAKKEVRYGKARNRQAMYGADVLSRIIMTEEEGAAGRATMQKLARESIAEAVAHLGEIAPVSHITISANPTMIYLLLGWDASPIRQALSPQLDLTTLELPVHEVMGEMKQLAFGAKVQILPGVANYLGGDVMVGVALARRFYPKTGKFLFIDAGTNGEIVLVVDDAILGIATSAGPAFEGGEVGSGMAAMPGAIETVRITPPDFWAEYGTINEMPPSGICGSGIIELVAELDKAGALERNGRIMKGMTSDAFMEDVYGKFYVLVPATSSATGQAVTISNADLGAIINTKAAIFAGCRKLINVVGIDFADLDNIFIAGDFGYHINIKDAIRIGMLPDIEPYKYEFMGNASLAGAAIAGLVTAFFDETKNLVRQATFLDLSEDIVFIEEYMAARFLPHTNTDLFPHFFRQST